MGRRCCQALLLALFPSLPLLSQDASLQLGTDQGGFGERVEIPLRISADDSIDGFTIAVDWSEGTGIELRDLAVEADDPDILVFEHVAEVTDHRMIYAVAGLDVLQPGEDILLATLVIECQPGPTATRTELVFRDDVYSIVPGAPPIANTVLLADGSELTRGAGLELVNGEVISVGPEACDDGADNDLDGLTDCDDPDCAPSCPETACDDCEVGTLECGGSVEGELTPEDCQLADETYVDVYRLEVSTPGPVRIEMHAQGLTDTVLALADASCETIAQNDDCEPDNLQRSCIRLPELAPGTYYVIASSVEPEQGGYRIDVRCPIPFRRADTNANGVLDISDAVLFLGYLFLGSPTELPCLDAVDTDDSGILNLSDAILPLNFLFLGGDPPRPPFPDCGPDLTEDALGCDAFEVCS